MTEQQTYPHEDGDVTVLGPEVFATSDERVVSWRGRNYHLAEVTTPALEGWQQSDLDKLVELHTMQDPRTITEMIAEDPYTEYVIEAVEPFEEGKTQGIGLDGSLWTGVKGPEVKVGDTVRLYDHGENNGRHGWALNGEVIEWRTEWERFVDRIAMLADMDRRGREHYEQAKDELDAWYGELQGVYKARIDRFRAERADFDIDGGTYEVYPVLMAQRIEAWVRSMEDDCTVEDFRSLPHDDQSKIIHAGKKDDYGISGHQFDSACAMARHVLEGGTV